MLSVRLVSVDHYMSPPLKELDAIYSEFRGAEIKQVPIIRIFGSTSRGQKVCLHVHGVFPYLYVPYDASVCDPDKLIYQLTSSIEKAINIALRNTNSNAHHVYKITPVKGIPFYGYHPKEHTFFKIYLYNPGLLKKAADLLQNGSVVGQVYQPHEAHLPYILQFFIDYNLHGMGFIDIESVKYRQGDNPILDIPQEYILPKAIMRISKSELEIDCIAMHIMNRREIISGNLAINPGLAAIWDNAKARSRQLNKTFEVDGALSQTRANVHSTKTETYFKERLKNLLLSKNICSENESTMENTSSRESINLNNTIYPEENNDVTLSNASLIESHSSVVNRKMRKSPQYEMIKLDDNDKKLLKILKELEENAGIEDDSILGSQLLQLNDSKEIGNIDEVDVSTEDENDLSISLPVETNENDNKTEDKIVNNSENIWETSFWSALNNSQDNRQDNSTLISQNIKTLTQHNATILDNIFEQPTQIDNDAEINFDLDKSGTEIRHETNLNTSFFRTVLTNNENYNLNNSFINSDHDLDIIYSSQSCPTPKHNKTNLSRVVNSIEKVTQCPKNEEDKIISQKDIKQVRNNTFEDRKLIISPDIQPLTRSELMKSLNEYNIPECVNTRPFYSNPQDNTSKREVGHMTLKIPSLSVNELEEFRTNSDLELYEWRANMFKELNLTEGPVNMKTINVFLSSESKCIITPVTKPPNVREVANWLKARELLHREEKKVEEKHVIKPVLMKYSMVNSPSEGGLNCSMNDSINLSPCTPLSEYKMRLTPDSIKSQSQKSIDSGIKRKAMKNARKSKKRLFRQLLDDLDDSNDEIDSSQGTANATPEENQNESSNDTVRGLLEQSDYVRGLLSDNVSSNNSEDTTLVQSIDNTHDIHLGEKNFKLAKTIYDHQYITLLCLEIHAQTRQDLRPDPEIDPIRAVFYAITNDVPDNHHPNKSENGVIVVDFMSTFDQTNLQPKLKGVDAANVIHTKDEYELLDKVIGIITKWDPDILAGYEIEMLSWGYLLQRASVLGVNVTQQINRASSMRKNDRQWGEEKTEVITVIGRVMLDIWRLLRHEVALMNYTFENVMYNILQQRVPLHSFRSLTFWWEHPTPMYRWIVVEYYLLRVIGIIKLLDQLDLVGRTCELARLFGIQFYEVLSRGSQFRVESMMLRLAKPQNYVAVSPSVQQRAHMRAPEFLPLILEPESRFYSDPVIVLDFQSLYPSMIIAYNYCFSTCLGRVEHLGKSAPFEFGASQLRVSKTMLTRLVENDLITISPCGVAFVVNSVRQGVLPRMLKEILDTRLMVKKTMKENADNRVLQRLLHSQQLGLKLIANVTYGYTAANFSGRMPCIEVGDSVVAKGRETLERAIKLVENNEKWNVKVVYGDTDSLFVLVPGRNRERAFEIGAEIAEAVTQENPHPVKLKLEKVYQPCILQTKKRYVGYMYESPSQKEPTYDAKGIETVRRDGCPAVAKILEKTIRILFETRDVSKVKSYICKKFSKLLAGEMSIQDLIFAKEFRGLHSYKPGACVPGLVLARNWIVHDIRSEPRRGERVPYVIVNGLPNTPLIQLVRSPRELLADPGLRVNAIYYITRVIIPPLNRCLFLIGVDVNNWFAGMPRKTQQQFLPTIQNAASTSMKKSTVSQYFTTQKCVACEAENKQGVCVSCQNNAQKTVFVLQEKLRRWERSKDCIELVCKSCCNRHDIIECVSLDCPTFFRLRKAERDCQQAPYIRTLMEKFF